MPTGIQARLLFSLTLLFKAGRRTWSLTGILMRERYLSGTLANKASDSLVKDVGATNISTGAGNLLGFFFPLLNLFLGSLPKLLGRWNGSYPSQTSVTNTLLFLKYVQRPTLILV